MKKITTSLLISGTILVQTNVAYGNNRTDVFKYDDYVTTTVVPYVSEFDVLNFDSDLLYESYAKNYEEAKEDVFVNVLSEKKEEAIVLTKEEIQQKQQLEALEEERKKIEQLEKLEQKTQTNIKTNIPLSLTYLENKEVVDFTKSSGQTSVGKTILNYDEPSIAYQYYTENIKEDAFINYFNSMKAYGYDFETLLENNDLNISKYILKNENNQISCFNDTYNKRFTIIVPIKQYENLESYIENNNVADFGLLTGGELIDKKTIKNKTVYVYSLSGRSETTAIAYIKVLEKLGFENLENNTSDYNKTLTKGNVKVKIHVNKNTETVDITIF